MPDKAYLFPYPQSDLTIQDGRVIDRTLGGGWREQNNPDELLVPYLRSTPVREHAEENEKHIEMLESLLLRIIDKHDRTLRNNQKALGMGFVSEVPEVVDARRYLDTIKAEVESGDQG